MENACMAVHCTYVDLSRLYNDYSNRAAAERPFNDLNVGWHPGDKGMKAFADLLRGEIDPWLSMQAP